MIIRPPAGCTVARIEVEGGYAVCLTPLRAADAPHGQYVLAPGRSWPNNRQARAIAEDLAWGRCVALFVADEATAEALMDRLVAARAPAPPGTSYVRHDGTRAGTVAAAAAALETDRRPMVTGVMVAAPGGELLTLTREGMRGGRA
ncbi:hypothetical protein ACE7GA_01480 [Roseomonas sp. CCTCC AB2023176]|uniref:hypothetical protein n=1 Tax=Roseomonas sp. CCTCC AB2023176 TaxID=3342640 RepID=UPI0035E16145